LPQKEKEGGRGERVRRPAERREGGKEEGEEERKGGEEEGRREG
jgi:hypothetical protein